MSNNFLPELATAAVAPKIVKSKTSLPDELLILNNGELFINTVSHTEVERLISSTPVHNGTLVKLLLIPGDLYKMVSHEDVDYGSQFVYKAGKTNTAKYAGVSDDFKLVPVFEAPNVSFSRFVLNRTLVGDIYNKTINLLTNNRTWVNLTVTESFSFRNISTVPDTHIGSNMLLYIVDFDITDEGMVIKQGECVTRDTAIEFIQKGIGEKQFLLRQYIKDTTCIQVAFNKEKSAGYFELLTRMVADKIEIAKVVRKGDRYNVSVNFDALIKE